MKKIAVVALAALMALSATACMEQAEAEGEVEIRNVKSGLNSDRFYMIWLESHRGAVECAVVDANGTSLSCDWDNVRD